MKDEMSTIRFEFVTHELNNGLQVILQPDPTRPLVSVHVMYHVGSKDEPPGRTGFAHLFEHLLFQGSANVGEAEHFRLIQEAGGSLNGTTWFDRTNYFETVPSNRLELALWLESDRMGWFLPAITQAKLDNQRGVVKNERRQSYENRPYGLATETVLGSAFPVGHPYRHPTIGYMEDLDRASLADVSQFFRQWYGPENAVLVVCGDFDPATGRRLVERYFGEIEPSPAPTRVQVESPICGNGRTESISDDVTVPRVYMMYHAPPLPAEDYETSVVLSSVLAGGRSSRLYRRLVYDRGIASDVHAYVWPLECVGMLWIVATARQGVSAPDLEEAIDETLGSLLSEGLRDEEVAGARNRARRQLLTRLEGVGGRAEAFALAATLTGDAGYVNDSFGRFAEITSPRVQLQASELLVPGNRTVLHVVPRTGREQEAAGRDGGATA